jgi:hypothetical protein
MVTGFLLLLLGCGGGGSGTASNMSPGGAAPPPGGAPPPPGGTGTVNVTAVDPLGASLALADLELESTRESMTTIADANGKGTFEGVSAGPVTVRAVYTDDFENYLLGHSATADLATGGHLSLTVEAQSLANPVIGAAGGFVDPEGVSEDGRSLKFRMILLYVFGNRVIDYIASAPLTVTLADCTPDTTNDAPEHHADCIGGSADFDASYRVLGESPQTFELDPFEYAATPAPYVASLLVDQSERIGASDPGDLRLRGFKYLLAHKLPADTISLAAFAADHPLGGSPALLPQTPVMVLGDDATAIDDLAALEGGGAPLYAALADGIDHLAATSPRSGPQRIVAVLTDGHDDLCGDAIQCGLMRDAVTSRSRATGTEVVVLAIGPDANRRALSELTAATRGRAFWIDEPAQTRLLLAALPDLFSRYGRGANVAFEIEADEAGTFRSGRTVYATVNVQECPFDCNGGSLPIAIPIP